MARARLLKPGFFANEELSSLPMAARLLFAGLWTLADRKGLLKDSPRWIDAQIFPFDQVKTDKLLSQLAAAGFVRRYEVDGQHYLQIINFLKHQTPHVKEPASIIPAPDEHETRPVQEPDKHESGTYFSGSDPSGRETGRETVAVPEAETGTGTEPKPPASAAPPLPGAVPSRVNVAPSPSLWSWDAIRAHADVVLGDLDDRARQELRGYFDKNPEWTLAALNRVPPDSKGSRYGYFKNTMDDCLAKGDPPRTLAKKRVSV